MDTRQIAAQNILADRRGRSELERDRRIREYHTKYPALKEIDTAIRICKAEMLLEIAENRGRLGDRSGLAGLELKKRMCKNLRGKRLVVLNADDGVRNGNPFQNGKNAVDDLLGMLAYLAIIRSNIRLTFRRIHKENIRFTAFGRVQLDVDRKTGASEADKAGISNHFQEILTTVDLWRPAGRIDGVFAVGLNRNCFDRCSGR